MSERYNGWPNRETWAAWVWITNTEHLYRHATRYQLNAQGLKNMFDDIQAGVEAKINTASIPMLLDIGSLWRVDWTAIAQALKGETP